MPARLRPSLPALLPAALALALFVAWIGSEGGYTAADWYPGLLLLAGLLAALLAGLGRRRPALGVAGSTAVGALTAYAAWSYLSILWANAPGLALEGANRTLAFLLAFALFAILPWRLAAARVALGAFVAAVGVVALVTLARMWTADDPSPLFLDARLESPLGYQNAAAALWTMAALPAAALAAERTLPAPLRGALLGLVTLLLAFGVLAQSRGWLLALPVVALAAVALVPGRVRLAVALAAALAGAAAAVPELLDVYAAGGGLRPDLSAAAVRAEAPGAARAAAFAALAVALVGTLAAALDRRVELSPAGARRARAAVLAALAGVAVAAGAIGWAAVDGEPVERLRDAWREFEERESVPAEEEARFGSLGTTRHDFWRVALEVTADHPLGGVGQDNYAAEYVARRDTDQEPRWIHSLPLRLATHTGIVGLLLFAGFVAAVGYAVLRRRRARDPDSVRLARVAVLPFVVWAVYGSLDWFWEYPALSAPAFAFAGMAVALARIPGEPPRRRVPPAATAALVAAVALVAAGPPYLAERATERALDDWGGDPVGALQRLDRAAELNPLSARADLAAGVLAQRAGLLEVARRRFERAAEREPRSWFARLELGLLAGIAGDEAAARRHLERARRLNPREPVVALALERLRVGPPLTPLEAEAQLRARALRRVGEQPPGLSARPGG